MSETSIISERNVSKKPIINTFKGILRVGNNSDLFEDTPDEFLNSTYFCPSSTDSSFYGGGQNITRTFLDDVSPNKRYSVKDSYSNMKLPVTDSMGNFLNFALGTESAEIGKIPSGGQLVDNEIQFGDDDTSTFAVVDTSNYIILGLSPRVLESAKTIDGGSLYIDSDKEKGKLVINNKFYHGASDESGTFTSTTADEQVRTIFTYDGSAKQYDAFVYNQNSYKLSNEDGIRRKDCYVTVNNIKNYVSQRLSSYLASRNSELPSGTIVSQYCDLKKWYCVSADTNGPDDKFSWQGYRPAMYSSGDAPYALWNNLMGRACHAETYLYYDGNKADHLTGELPPDFKRGYLLCNGESHTIQLSPDYIQTNENDKKSLDLFFNLFYTIGYFYQNRYEDGKLVKPGIRNVIPVAGKSYYALADSSPAAAKKTSNSNTDLNILYGIDMAIILAFMAFNKKFKASSSESYTIDDAINWLKGESIPDEYVYNIVDSTGNTNFYSYTDNSGNTISINIGREINKFTDRIPYYYFNNGKLTLTECEIYNMAEVRHMAKLFVNQINDGSWNNYNFAFYLPKLYTNTDEAVNTGESYRLHDKKESILPQVTIGMFIGSNGLIAADYVTLNDNTTINMVAGANTVTANYKSSPGQLPHAHAVAKGDLTFEANNGSWHRPTISSVNRMTLPNPEDCYNTRTMLLTKKDISDSYSIAANYHSTPYDGFSASSLSSSEMKNYILQDVANATSHTVYNEYSALHGYEFKINGDTNNTFKWYGASSEPIWLDDKDTFESKSTKYTIGNSNQGYFRPESIKVLPLIKL